MSSPAKRQGTKAERRLEIFSVYSFSSRAPSVMLVVTMVGSFAPSRLLSRLYRLLMRKAELNSEPRSSRMSRSAPAAVYISVSSSPAGSAPKCSPSSLEKKSGLET